MAKDTRSSRSVTLKLFKPISQVLFYSSIICKSRERTTGSAIAHDKPYSVTLSSITLYYFYSHAGFFVVDHFSCLPEIVFYTSQAPPRLLSLLTDCHPVASSSLPDSAVSFHTKYQLT